VIPGFSSAESIPLQGDGTHMETHWKEKNDLSELVGKDAVLMFEFKEATLWSYRFAGQSHGAPPNGH